ncbi:MAG: tRNA (N6-isopentenyl adenosine(37)-C2)-methylthiotransferase MiaB [Alphaproteobacteria bacterium]|nr:tRNA (N6-isopentenyl adenosine(37)-C2)-methylthiotransferase MiaB [Alphaproteobacteria bacterium]
MRKKLFIKTYGCQMNVYDSARMTDVLAPLGYVPVDQPEGADMIILNTCHIREKAAEKVYSELGRLRPLKRAREEDGGEMILAVGGCVAQAEGDEVRRRAPWVDVVFGPQAYHRLPDMVSQVTRQAIVDTEFPVEAKFDFLPEESSPRGAAAFLTIQEGCDKFCTFCVVPYTRGAEFSRPLGDVLAEARRLVENGTSEITLLGQNVNAYHGNGADRRPRSLADLIRELALIDGLHRLRYTTSHPRDMDQALISAHGDVEALMPFLHLPVQSGSDRILAEMNRRHTAAEYRSIVERIRLARPDIALSSDFIVGFPGETDAEFQSTLDLVADVEFASAYSFRYSTRPGTPAADRDDQVPEDVKSARLNELQALIDRQSRAFNEATVGRELQVLLERPGRHSGQLVGRSPYMQAVHVHADDSHLGRIASVRIEAAMPNSLSGSIVGNDVGRLRSVDAA